MSLVYSYTRFSAMKQAEGHSAERQAAYAAKWAADHGLTLDTSLSMKDEGLSAYHEKHVKSGALGAFLKAVDDGLVPKGSFLIVEGLDRLSRAEPIQAQAQLAQIVNGGITVVTASDGKSYSRETLKANPMDLVYSLLVMIRAHEESDTKSKRVRAAYRKQCEGWKAGTYRGLVRLGADPTWVKLEGCEWVFVPERAEAMRTAIELYCAGNGSVRIKKELAALGLPSVGGHNPSRLRTLRSLIGVKEIEIDGENYQLEGYYPALITPEQWDSLQGVKPRSYTRDSSDVPSILSGCGALKCAYCGSAMTVQNSLTKRLPNGSLPEWARLLRCCLTVGSVRATERRCSAVPAARAVRGGSSCHAAPFERAMMSFCSDVMNLRSLYEGDGTNGPGSRLAEARAALADIDAKLERLLTVIMETDKPPASFAAKARELEEEKTKLKQTVERCEREVAQASRADVKAMAGQWRKLVADCELQKFEPRMKARKLVADTFERVALYWLKDEEGCYGMVLHAKGGMTRVLRIDAKGRVVEAEDITARPELRVA